MCWKGNIGTKAALETQAQGYERTDNNVRENVSKKG